MQKTEWIICPVCKQKTRNKIREDTVMINFPLFCPKCKQESLIEVKNMQVKVIKELPFRNCVSIDIGECL